MSASIEALREKQAKELRDAELAAEITEAFPVDLLPENANIRMVHVYALHGYVASVHIGDSFKNETLTVQQALELAERMNPEALYLVSNGFKSFRPEAGIEGEREEDVELVSPYTVKLDYFGNTFSFAATVGGHLVRVDICISDPDYRISMEMKDVMGGRRCENDSPVYPRDHFDRCIKWARGSDEYPHSYTLYSL